MALLFGDREDALQAAARLIQRATGTANLAMTKRDTRFFAKDLEDRKLGVKYRYHNFYVKLL